ncbi:MAG TPA: ATP-binding cassette domain-containing protein [Niabella sp.]|nr:ATP-binding cassette domain-containing protein [Niabella sp.]HRO84774.1 ATP-binding cassette domain-containing protein [Niabella sp.]
MQNICFTLHRGNHLALMGPAASGKTLLANVLCGNVFFNGMVSFIKDGVISKPKITFVPAVQRLKNLSNTSELYYQQRFNSADAEDSLTLKQQLLQKGDEQKIDFWLNKFQLTHRANSPLIQLSNGELKKTQIIGYLLSAPDILILDNAFTGLDINSRKTLHLVLNELAATGTTIILIADAHELPCCITHFITLEEGSMKAYAPIELYESTSQQENIIEEKQIPSFERNGFRGPIIQMKGVNIKYGEKQILSNIHWEVMHGECWQVKGANGAGKSTLLSLITADNPQSYSQPLYLFGKKRGSGESIWDIKKKIGFVSPELQNYFDPSITVFQTIASGYFDTMGLYRKLSEKQKQKVMDWLTYFSLSQYADNRLTELSSGNKRLVFIARALVKEPLILAMDEPCQGLDNIRTQQILKIVDEVFEKTGVTVIFISHYDEDLPNCIEKILNLQNSKSNNYIIKNKKDISLQAI